MIIIYCKPELREKVYKEIQPKTIFKVTDFCSVSTDKVQVFSREGEDINLLYFDLDVIYKAKKIFHVTKSNADKDISKIIEYLDEVTKNIEKGDFI